MWHGQNKEEKRRARIFTPTAHCLFVAITFCALIFHQICTIAAVSIGFSLCFLVFWSHPMASKKGMFPLSCCSYRIIKDHPDPIHVWAPQRAKICHSWRFSERWSPPRSLLRELSLDPHSIRMPQNAHHLAEQIQKTGVWCPIGQVNDTKTIAQLCPILCDPIHCSPPGSSVHGDSPGKNTGVGYHTVLQGIIPTQGWNPGLLHCRWILYCLSHQGSPIQRQMAVNY